MKSLIIIVSLMLASIAAVASTLPDAPQPQAAVPGSNGYSSGFGFDNQLYALQGWTVAVMVGPLTNRPWLGAAAGIGSCMTWRAIHDQGYKNDPMFGYNRVAFCALGAATGYATDKWLFRIHKDKSKGINY